VALGPSDTPTTSSRAPKGPGARRATGSGIKSAPWRRDAHGEADRAPVAAAPRTPSTSAHAPAFEARGGVREPPVRPRAP